MEEKGLNILAVRSYLFCVGFDLLGGILRKLELTFLNGFFSSGCKLLKASVDESMLVEDAFVSTRRRAPCASCG